MADYTPITSFSFNGTTYTPSTAFDFTAGVTIDPTGNIATNLDNATASFTAYNAAQATISSTLDNTTASLYGYVAVQGDIEATLDGITAVFDAYIPNIADITATLEGPTASIIGKLIQNRGIIQSLTLDNTVGGIIGNYDPNVTRWITANKNVLWQDTAKMPPVKIAMPRNQGERIDHQARDQQSDGTLQTTKTGIDIEQGTRIDIADIASQDQGSELTTKTAIARDQGTRTDMGIIHASIDDGAIFNTATEVIAQQMTKVYPSDWHARIQDSGANQHDFLHSTHAEPPLEFQYTPDRWDTISFDYSPGEYAVTNAFDFSFGVQVNMATGHSFGVARSEFYSPSQQVTKSRENKECVIVEESRRPPRGKSVWIDYPRPDPDPLPPTGTTITIPSKGAYIMENTTSVTLEDLTDIEMDSISLKFDADSFAWQFSGTLLDPAQLPLVKKLPDGSTIKLIITINGKVFHVFVEEKAKKRRFGKTEITISGRSLSAKLAWPYFQPSTGTQGSLLTVQQLADLHLPAGWTINWSAVTWNVTAGAYSYQNRTPIQAIADIALTMGAMIVPSTESQELNIMPRYPVLPWNFAATTVDVAIPEAAILELTERDTSRQYANGIYIHGAEIGGVLGFCRLNGTAGDVLLQTVSNPIMTDVIGLRAAGERYLAGEYTQPEISAVKTAMDGTTIPFIDVGTFVGVTVDGVETKAIVSGVTIETKFPDVFQEIKLGEDTQNSWLAFQSLLPKDPLLVGTLTSTDGTTSIIQLIDGGIVRVRGTGTVNNKYYIRSGQIQGDAPNMVQNDIVI